MVLNNPPICLEVFYSNVQQGQSANEYTVHLTTSGQGYNGGTSFYYLTNIATGMWTANNSYGYAFRIKTITNLTTGACDVVLEDVDGFNALIDPGGTGGGPANDTLGYIFELNASGYPILHEVGNPPNVVWIDSLVARFAFLNPNVGPTGATGATGHAYGSAYTAIFHQPPSRRQIFIRDRQES